MPESNTRYYSADSGDKLYRRSMYTFWKRAAPPASMDIFNAPDAGIVYRPPRADQYAAAGPGDAQRPAVRRGGPAPGGKTLKQGGPQSSTRLDFAARRLLARSLRPQEEEIVLASLDRLLEHYQAHPDGAKKLLSVGQSPADPEARPPQHLPPGPCSPTS